MKHPFQLVLTNKSGTHLFVSVRNNLQVFDLSNGDLVGSWVDTVEIINPLKKQQEKIKAQEEAAKKAESESSEGGEKKLKNNNKKAVRVQKSPGVIPGTVPIFNVVRSLSLSKDEKFLIGTTDSDKAAIIFSIDFSNKENCLKLIKRQTFPKRPCAVSVGDDSEFIVADKFGDVYRTTIDDKPSVDEKSLVPILGHVSMLTDVLFAELDGKKFILTADRDEHIRVTNYPVSYVIKSWLFGHHEFISAMHIPKFDPSLLISGGGDDYICLWKWYDNKLLTKIELRDFVQPFLNEAHYPPERFLTPESTFEFSVTKILTHQKDGRRIIIVACENVKCILTFELLEDCSVTHVQTLTTEHPIIDVCLNEAKGQLIGSIDIESNDKSLDLFAFNDQLKLEAVDNKVFDTIAKEHGCEVESREDFYPLYHVNTLRKRSERVTTKQLNE